ncbi:hypothetical protein Pint_22575 [Pistacia integerrima]|uniref:Uncharacterized protein n=1 Tax=Pistacia integerrima TaxID=434235 RepID=A0ACC0YH55_9ROSI|nr:hypothetical protein Pint_22575 [Pistacia integerrima]
MRTRMRTVSNLRPLAIAEVFKNVVIKARKEAELETAVIEKLKRRFKVSQGNPTPFGATARDGGVKFCIFSSNAVSATLCLITLSDLQEAVVSRGQFGVLAPDDNCWPQMVCMVRNSEDEVVASFTYFNSY